VVGADSNCNCKDIVYFHLYFFFFALLVYFPLFGRNPDMDLLATFVPGIPISVYLTIFILQVASNDRFYLSVEGSQMIFRSLILEKNRVIIVEILSSYLWQETNNFLSCPTITNLNVIFD